MYRIRKTLKCTEICEIRLSEMARIVISKSCPRASPGPGISQSIFDQLCVSAGKAHKDLKRLGNHMLVLISRLLITSCQLAF